MYLNESRKPPSNIEEYRKKLIVSFVVYVFTKVVVSLQLKLSLASNRMYLACLRHEAKHRDEQRAAVYSHHPPYNLSSFE